MAELIDFKVFLACLAPSRTPPPPRRGKGGPGAETPFRSVSSDLLRVGRTPGGVGRRPECQGYGTGRGRILRRRTERE